MGLSEKRGSWHVKSCSTNSKALTRQRVSSAATGKCDSTHNHPELSYVNDG